MALMAKPRMHGLTRLRFFLALWVVLFHFRPRAQPLPSPLLAVAKAGYLGVPFFFVLSGFVLAMSYPRESLGQPGGTRRFALRRFARLYPGFAAAILAFALLQAVNLYVGMEAAFDPREHLFALPLTLLGLHAWVPSAACAWNCPSWSLSVEFAFYAAFPLLVRLPRGGRVVAFAAATAYTITMLLGPFDLPREFSMYHPTMNVASFVLGTLLWDLDLGRDAQARRAAALLAVPTVASLAFLNLALHEHPVLNSVGSWFAVLPTIVALSRPSAADDPSLLTLLGNASYALYLCHVPLHLGFQGAAGLAGLATGTYAFEAAALLLAVAASVLLYKGLELPAERWLLRSLGQPRPAPSPAAVPP
jgi:peptidoglycan/LPS O-acetylase OafA/YrhL